MSFKQWLLDLFKDERKSTSVKPVIAIIGTLFLCGALVVSLYTNKENTQCSSDVIDAVTFITLMGMGADTLDKFSHKKSINNGQDSSNNQEANK